MEEITPTWNGGVIYNHMFSRFGWITVRVGILLALAAPGLKRLAT
jgi:hypothetical protein